jgi:hypothetical protein
MRIFNHSISFVVASAALTASLSSGAAQAIVVNVSGVDYDITTFTDGFGFSPAGPMPWYGSYFLALEFAEALAAAPGGNQALNYPGFGFVVAPFDPVDDDLVHYWQYNPNLNPPGIQSGVDSISSTRIWAQAVPVPGPLPIFGAAAAFGMSRRLRRRINLGA